MILIITNNPKTADFVTNHYPAETLSGIRLLFCPLREAVYTQVRSYIHRNWRLLNHAMYGNIQLHKQPYRSMLLTESVGLDIVSLQLWEQAMERVSRSSIPPYADHVLEDFQELDFMLFKNTLTEQPA
ncbi:MAG: GrdX family protein [Treponema sp.]